MTGTKEFLMDIFGQRPRGIKIIPEGKSGDWRVEDDVDDENGCIFQNLAYKEQVIMTNNPENLPKFKSFVDRATGKVLINGLGLGVSLFEILKKPQVTFVKVIESSEDVIKLVAPSFQDDRVDIVCADAFEYEDDLKYDVVWHAIWTSESDVIPNDKKRLEEKYSNKCEYQGFIFLGFSNFNA